MERHSVTFGSRRIEFVLERKGVKNINLNVKPDMRVMVSANEEVPLNYILSFVKGKASWILRNIDNFKELLPEPKSEPEFVSGESIRYLGKQYRLRVVESEEESIKYFRGFIYLHVKDRSDYKRKRHLYQCWIREKAFITFNSCLDKIYPLVGKYGVEKPELKIKTMRSRWGSCIHDKGRILLNFDLIKAPKYCIDYVILHELIHFLHNNHDIEFYTTLAVMMPDWKERKKILDHHIIREL